MTTTAASSHTIRIKNGRVIDPVNHIDGEARDVLIHNGKIVAELPPNTTPETLDASGGFVLPGAIEPHSHIASMPVNTARAIQSATGYDTVCPTAPDTSSLYASLGYTTAIEAAVPPSAAALAHFQLDDMPHLDTGLLLVLGNHEALIEKLETGKKDDRAAAIDIVARLLQTTGAFGIKAVNPAAVAAWRRDPSLDHIDTIDDTASGSRVSPRVMLEMLTEAADALDLPHPTHVHGPQLGEPGNVDITLDMLNALAGRRLHLAHLQYYCYGKTADNNFMSAAARLLDHLRDHPEVTADLGLVAFGPAFTATADLPLEFNLYRHIGASTGGTKPARFFEHGNEDGFGVMPLVHLPRSASHAMQWATGLELALLADRDLLWQLSLTIDHPNGGSFLNYPTLIAQLMSKPRRDEQLERCHQHAREHTGLSRVEREMTLSEIAILTRASPARALGLTHKGHLGPGADADVTIYNDRLDDPEHMFRHPAVTLRRGHASGATRLRADAVASSVDRSIDPERGHALYSDWLTRTSSLPAEAYDLPDHQLTDMTAITR